MVVERSRGGYPPDPDAILRYPGNVLVGPSDNRVRISESESEEGVEVSEPVSARTRARETKTESRMAKGEQSRQLSRQSQRYAVDASKAADATVPFHSLCNSVARDEQTTLETHRFPWEGPNSV